MCVYVCVCVFVCVMCLPVLWLCLVFSCTEFCVSLCVSLCGVKSSQVYESNLNYFLPTLRSLSRTFPPPCSSFSTASLCILGCSQSVAHPLKVRSSLNSQTTALHTGPLRGIQTGSPLSSLLSSPAWEMCMTHTASPTHSSPLISFPSLSSPHLIPFSLLSSHSSSPFLSSPLRFIEGASACQSTALRVGVFP